MENISNKKVSIIIIVKNGKETLQRSIDSVLNQSFTQFELIIVDDGSTDNTVEIINKNKEKDSRVVDIILPKNIGRAAARNVGLGRAVGSYLLFLDADDSLPVESIETQVKVAQGFNADIVFGRFKCFKTGSYEGTESHYTDDIICKTMNNITLNDHPLLIQNNQVIGRLYSHEFLSNDNIRFNEYRRNGEDLLFNFLTVSKAKNISLIHEEFIYNYTIGNYFQKATIEKCTDARDNLIEISKHIDASIVPSVYAMLLRKFADFITLLGRADKSFGDDLGGFAQYIASLRPLAMFINTEIIDELPEWRGDIIRFIQSGYSAGALRRWKNRSAYWSQWTRSARHQSRNN